MKRSSLSPDPSGTILDRREFLGLSIGGLIAAACGGGGETRPSADGGIDGGADGALASMNDPFTIWTELRDALRGSPDHAPQAAARAVATRDPKVILAFVQNEIATLPPPTWSGAVTGARWGTRATLRGAAGTPREKAELLAMLLEQAGFTATVMSGLVGLSKPITTSDLFGPFTRPDFSPKVDDATLAAWTAALAGPTSTPIDPNGTELSALIKQITAALPSGVMATTGSPTTVSALTLGLVPVVSVTIDGKSVLANPCLSGSALGAAGIDSASAANPMDAPPQVTVELFGANTQTPTTPVSLARLSASAADLAGRQLAIGFAPQADLKTLALRRTRDLQSYVAYIRGQGADLDDSTRASLTTTGKVVTLQGDLVAVKPDGSASVNGVPIVTAAPDPAAVAKVASLAVSVKAAAFPAIALEVVAMDAAGQAVVGLGASAFRVTEGGTPMGLLVTKTPAQPLRVALVIDADDPLDSGETMASLARQVTTMVATEFPGATLITGGGDGSSYGDLTDPNAVVKEIGDGDADDVWRTLSVVNQHAPTVIVCAGDFQGSSTPYRADVARGAPVIAVGAGLSANAAAMRDVATLSNGQALPGAAIAAIVDATRTALKSASGARPYELRYGAPVSGTAARKVGVSLAGSSVVASATYDAPAASATVAPPGWIGLHLVVTVGDRSVRRTLAGLSLTELQNLGQTVPQAVLDDVRAMLIGATMLSFEGGPAALSVWLDDMLTCKLATKPVWDAIQAKDAQALLDAFETPRPCMPDPIVMMQALPVVTSDAGGATYPEALRIVGWHNKPAFGVGTTEKVDLYPLSSFATLATDGSTSFTTTLERTAQLSIVEAHALEDSATTRLAGQSLRRLAPGPLYDADVSFIDASVRTSMLDALNQYSTHYRLIPPIATPNAFYAVDATTGSVFAVLPDGTGGGASAATCKGLSDTEALLNILAFMGLPGFYYILGIAVARVLTAVAIVFDNMEDPSFTWSTDDFLKSLGASIACEAVKDRAGSLVTGQTLSSKAATLGGAFVKADQATAGARGGQGLLNCDGVKGPLGC